MIRKNCCAVAREFQPALETRPEPASTRKPDGLPRLDARRI